MYWFFFIYQGFDFSLGGRVTPWEWDVPNCFISHLKTIEIKGDICGTGVEMLRYFLKNAKVLEKLVIN